MRQARICLIVDNPLRDLDGLVLLGWRLAQEGAATFLVPMYDQGFDVPALAPDLVLANYARPNNADLLKSYKQAGIMVGILDTEGVGGKNADQFAEMVGRSRCGDYVDLYCLWGGSQYRAFVKGGVLPERIVRVTGCPRYDFCSEPWRRALALPDETPGYVLVNTNFPTVNPRFSTGQEHELRTMVSVGFEESFARQFMADGTRALGTVIEVCGRLSERFPDRRLVLRPHPFENLAAYDVLARRPNVLVRQEGTSLAWIAPARLLLHQNCSTAIEAMMLGKEPLALEWFNTPALRVAGPAGVSRPASSYDDLVRQIDGVLRGDLEAVPTATEKFRLDVVADFYLANDGKSSGRVAEAILETVARKTRDEPGSKRRPSPSVRGRIANLARMGLGYRWSGALRRSYTPPLIERRRQAKVFTIEQVAGILDRIAGVARGARAIEARGARAETRLAARQMSGATIELVKSS